MYSDIKDDFSLLPVSSTYRELLPAYLSPYLIYVAIAFLSGQVIPIQWEQIIKFGCTASVMVWFLRTYRIGPFSFRWNAVALAGLPVALGLWIGPLYLFNYYHLIEISPENFASVASPLSFCMKLINAAFLVAFFEELFIRVYLMTWFHQAGASRQGKGLVASLVDTFDQSPQNFKLPPISPFSIALATLFFSAGHRLYEFPSAALYFLFTSWLYHKTRSLWVCIVIHGLANLSIALLARYGGMDFLS